MNKTTKQLFNAPWTIEEEAPLAWYCVIDSKDSVVANDVRDKKTVNRIARLPELYDELKRMIKVECANRCSRREPCHHPCDLVRPSIELLRKVRNGE